MKIIIILLIALFLVCIMIAALQQSSSSSPPPPPPPSDMIDPNTFCVGKDIGNYPHPYFCDRFVMCISPNLPGQIMTCGHGLLFSIEAGMCIAAEEVIC
ncbi:hypothetical protein SlsnVgp054 [Spodoptera littoralis nucleopolyhedrovirus]|uniref:Chitin-binding type-2 domain-containing protein n=1 Tax=Spodoptera littoralis nuclear polyhedrosis virus TaxID=10456 RepID=M1J495_NPVSL|nr:hypothetical protein SlsnVgp054 [Spodoptera littoralis nucleopolyhedrovirus]AGE89909.1 hypothetical protein SlsnVgp054 [Spodoptera littoralis nucleopolyhedrovirus]